MCTDPAQMSASNAKRARLDSDNSSSYLHAAASASTYLRGLMRLPSDCRVHVTQFLLLSEIAKLANSCNRSTRSARSNFTETRSRHSRSLAVKRWLRRSACPSWTSRKCSGFSAACPSSMPTALAAKARYLLNRGRRDREQSPPRLSAPRACVPAV